MVQFSEVGSVIQIFSSRRKIVKIRAGTIDLSGEEDRVTPQDRDVAEIITHTEYNQSQYLHNIGLLRLAEPLKFTSYVQPACLHTKKDIPENLLAAGWGLILKDGIISFTYFCYLKY